MSSLHGYHCRESAPQRHDHLQDSFHDLQITNCRCHREHITTEIFFGHANLTAFDLVSLTRTCCHLTIEVSDSSDDGATNAGRRTTNAKKRHRHFTPLRTCHDRFGCCHLSPREREAQKNNFTFSAGGLAHVLGGRFNPPPPSVQLQTTKVNKRRQDLADMNGLWPKLYTFELQIATVSRSWLKWSETQLCNICPLELAGWVV